VIRKFQAYGLVLLAGLAFSRIATSEMPAAHPTGEQRGAIKNGSQSYLGIDVRAIGDDQVTSLKLKDTHGAEIIRVDHDAPAGKMDLRVHDVVLQMNGVLIDSEEHLRRMMHDCPPGKMVVMTIARDGQTITTSAPMADRVELERQAWSQHVGVGPGLPGPQAPPLALPTGEEAAVSTSPSTPVPTSRYSKSFLGSLLTSPTYTGALLEILRPQLAQFFGVSTGAGLLVSSVADNSPAAMAGLKAGDVITRANLKPMKNVSSWTRAIREAKGRPITVEVVRDRQEKTLTLTPDVKHHSSL
jgi:serine protease Do